VTLRRESAAKVVAVVALEAAALTVNPALPARSTTHRSSKIIAPGVTLKKFVEGAPSRVKVPIDDPTRTTPSRR